MKFVYLSKPEDKQYDFDSILNYTALSMEEIPDFEAWEIDEVYADGWISVPNGIDDMINDIKANKSKVSGIVLFSLEEISMDNLEALIKTGKDIYCVLANYVGVVSGPKADILLRIKKSKMYYKNVNSMKIRHGVKASKKTSGAAPFGYSHEDGKLVKNDDYATLESILRLHKAGLSSTMIAKRIPMLTPARIYGIIRTAEARTNG